MRRSGAAKREILPDPKYASKIVAKFVNMMMYGGKKSTAEKIMYEAMGAMEDRAKQDALKLFKAAVDNCKPAVEVKSRRVGGSTYQVPVDGAPLGVAVGGGAAPRGEEHVGAARRRAPGRGQQSRDGCEEARRHSQDGGGQQGVRALSLVATEIRRGGPKPRPPFSLE
jgi:hypothetical protein